MACIILSMSFLLLNTILIEAEPHASKENTQTDSPNENTEIEAIVSAELNKSDDQELSGNAKEFAKLISSENIDENDIVETITVDKKDGKSIIDFVLNNKDRIQDILDKFNGKNNKDKIIVDDFKDDDVNSIEDDSVKVTNKKEESEEDNGPDADQYRAEINAGNKAEVFGTNPHYFQPHAYKDLGRRRFSSRKHIKEVNPAPEETADTHLEPKLASPEFVLEIAKKSALLEASKPRNPTNYIIDKDSLRSGNYWNSVWQENIDPGKMLRSEPSKQSSSLGIVRTQINPGSKLYQLVKKLSKISPRLIYVINKKSNF